MILSKIMSCVCVLQDYYDFQEEHRSSILSSLGRKYHAIGPLLVKVEGLVAQSNTGKCHRLTHYYEHWETKVFQSLVKVRRGGGREVGREGGIYSHVILLNVKNVWGSTVLY